MLLSPCSSVTNRLLIGLLSGLERSWTWKSSGFHCQDIFFASYFLGLTGYLRAGFLLFPEESEHDIEDECRDSFTGVDKEVERTER